MCSLVIVVVCGCIACCLSFVSVCDFSHCLLFVGCLLFGAMCCLLYVACLQLFGFMFMFVLCCLWFGLLFGVK